MINIEKTIYDELKTWNKEGILAMIKILNSFRMGRSPRSQTLSDSEIKKYLEKVEPKITTKQKSIISELVLPEYAKWVETGRKAGKMPPKNVVEKWIHRINCITKTKRICISSGSVLLYIKFIV